MEDKIFDNMSFSDLMKDIYTTSKAKEQKISALVDKVSGMMRNISDVEALLPLLKEYMEVGVKNDDIVVKMASIVQRHMSAKMKESGNSEMDGVTKEEIEQLLAAAQGLGEVEV